MAATERLELEILAKDFASQVLRKFGKSAEVQGKRAEKSFRRVNKATGAITSNLRLMAAQFLGIAAAIQALRTGTRTFLSFSESIGEISTILDDTQFSLASVEQEVLDLSLALGEQETLIAKGFYQTLSAGVTDASDAMIVLNASAKLGIAGLASTESAVDILTTVINAYGLAVTDATDVTDILFKTVELGKTRIPELASNLGAILPVAAELGVNLEQVSAAIATMTKQGASTSEAVTRLASIFTLLQKKAGDVDEAFQTIGESFDRDTLRSKGLTETLLLLRQAFEGNDNALVELIGRKEGITGLFSLTKDGAEVLKETLISLEQRLGATDKAFEKQLITPAREFKILVGGVRQGLLELGRTLVTTFTDGSKEFGTITDAAERLRDSVESLAAPLRTTLGLMSSLGVVSNLAAQAANIANRAVGGIEAEAFAKRQQELNDALIINAELTRSLITGDNDFTETNRINARKRRQAISDEKVELEGLAQQLQDVANRFVTQNAQGEDGVPVWLQARRVKAMQPLFDELKERMAAVGVQFDNDFTLGRTKVVALISKLRELGVAVDEIHELPPVVATLPGTPEEQAQALGFLDGFTSRLREIRGELTDARLGEAAADGVFFALDRGFDRLASDIVEGKANFSDFANQVVKDLGRILIKLLLLRAVRGILPGLAEGGVTPAVEDVLARGGVRGNLLGHFPIKSYARGGIATTPQLAVFGEGNSPGGEAFVPLGGDRKIPVKFPDGGGAGGGTFTVNYTIQALDSRGVRELLIAEGQTIAELNAAWMSSGKSRKLVNAVRSVAGGRR